MLKNWQKKAPQETEGNTGKEAPEETDSETEAPDAAGGEAAEELTPEGTKGEPESTSPEEDIKETEASETEEPEIEKTEEEETEITPNTEDWTKDDVILQVNGADAEETQEYG